MTRLLSSGPDPSLLDDGNLNRAHAPLWFALCIRIWRRDEGNAVVREDFVRSLLVPKFDIMLNLLATLSSPSGSSNIRVMSSILLNVINEELRQTLEENEPVLLTPSSPPPVPLSN